MQFSRVMIVLLCSYETFCSGPAAIQDYLALAKEAWINKIIKNTIKKLLIRKHNTITQ